MSKDNNFISYLAYGMVIGLVIIMVTKKDEQPIIINEMPPVKVEVVKEFVEVYPEPVYCERTYYSKAYVNAEIDRLIKPNNNQEITADDVSYILKMINNNRADSIEFESFHFIHGGARKLNKLCKRVNEAS